jgi:hypothetical protein
MSTLDANYQFCVSAIQLLEEGRPHEAELDENKKSCLL